MARGTKKAIGDPNKPRISLLPKEIIWEAAKALTFGANKYNDDFNYRKGIEILWLLDAAQRHILQFIDGEDFDSETKTHHLGNAVANLSMATWMYYNKPELDNRWRKNANTKSKKTKSKRKVTNKGKGK